jgi:hypothetical protein
MWRNLTINVPRGHKLIHLIARHGHRSHRRHDTHTCNGEPNSPVSKLPFSRISTGSSSKSSLCPTPTARLDTMQRSPTLTL